MTRPRNNIPVSTHKSYRVLVEGTLEESWSDWLGGMDITTQPTEDDQPLTILTGPVVDQAALRAILNRLWDLNVCLIAVRQLQPTAEEEDAGPADPAESEPEL